MFNDEDLKSDEFKDEGFQHLYEESLREIQEGEILKGRVIEINKDYVIIDIGYKSEGQVHVREFMGEDGELTVSVGDEVDVFLERKEGDEGFVVLSKAKADQILMWDTIEDALNSGSIVEGRIIQRVKGGFIVDLKGIHAFLPGSHVDIRPVQKMDSLIGNVFRFKVLKANKIKGNIILSRRVLLEEERTKERERLLATLEEGEVIEGVVKNITDYGVFIDLGGLDGLLHITDISWGRVVKPSEHFSIGDRVTVRVLRFDKETGKVSLGFKQLKPDPWEGIDERYPVGTKVKGRVVNITDYGAFVEIESGVEGLVHVSEMSWTKRIRHPSQKVSVNDEVEVVILSIDKENKRLSLGMKQLEPNPWDIIAEKYSKGSKVKGKITNITDFGIFVEIEEGIDGLVHRSDISWAKTNKQPSELFKVGEEVEAVVLNIDRDNERFSLGIKQLEKDPWKDIADRYHPGMSLHGKVTNIADFGVFVELEEGIEGLIHISEFGRNREKVVLPEVNEEINVEILNIDPEERKIGLSIIEGVEKVEG